MISGEEEYCHDEHGDGQDEGVGHDAGAKPTERVGEPAFERPFVVVGDDEEVED